MGAGQQSVIFVEAGLTADWRSSIWGRTPHHHQPVLWILGVICLYFVLLVVPCPKPCRFIWPVSRSSNTVEFSGRVAHCPVITQPASGILTNDCESCHFQMAYCCCGLCCTHVLCVLPCYDISRTMLLTSRIYKDHYQLCQSMDVCILIYILVLIYHSFFIFHIYMCPDVFRGEKLHSGVFGRGPARSVPD